MAGEVNLKPGWFIKDVRRAAERLSDWSTGRDASRTGSTSSQSEQSHSQPSPSPLSGTKTDPNDS